MDNHEYLLTSCQSSQQFSASLFDCKNKNTLKIYRNGGAVPPKALEIVGQDYVLSAEANKPLLHVWPLNSQEVDKNIRLILPGPASCAVVSPANQYLAVSIDLKLYIWQLGSGKLLAVQQRHYQPITSLRFSSDSQYVVTGGADGILVVYFLGDLVAMHHSLLSQSNLGQVEPVYTKNDHSSAIQDIHTGVFGGQSRLATCSKDQTARVYTLETGDLLLVLVFTSPLTTILLDSPCWKLYAGTASGVVQQWDLKNPPRTLTHHVDKDKEKVKQWLGHKAKIVAMALNSSNTILATGSDDKFVFTWSISTQSVLQKFEHPAPITNLKFVPTFGNFLAQQIKPQIVLKPLERTLDPDSDEFTLSLVQNEDLEFSDDENSKEKEKSRQRLGEENLKLRIANSQLYRAALEISKKYQK